jgi:hypothetical protein
MCDNKYQQKNLEYQRLLLEQMRILSNEIKAWRMTSTQSQRWSLEEFIRSTDFCGWQYSLERGVLKFPGLSKRIWQKFIDLFKR